ncbi:MAG: hypothetical protein H5U29_00165 [Pusillimonas sp.]|nr:hypothetical protein [Pusillimonas sp.]
MATNQIKVQIKLAWWIRWYLMGVVLMARLTGQQPDPERIGYWVAKAARVKYERH